MTDYAWTPSSSNRRIAARVCGAPEPNGILHPRRPDQPEASRAASGMFVPGPKIAATPASFRKP